MTDSEYIQHLEKELKHATIALAAAVSAYSVYAKRNGMPRSPADAMYTTRKNDFDIAVFRAQGVCRGIERKQA